MPGLLEGKAEELVRIKSLDRLSIQGTAGESVIVQRAETLRRLAEIVLGAFGAAGNRLENVLLLIADR